MSPREVNAWVGLVALAIAVVAAVVGVLAGLFRWAFLR